MDTKTGFIAKSFQNPWTHNRWSRTTLFDINPLYGIQPTAVSMQAHFQQFDTVSVQFDPNKAAVWLIYLFNILWDLKHIKRPLHNDYYHSVTIVSAFKWYCIIGKSTCWWYTQRLQCLTSPSKVFSILPFTILAYSGSSSFSSWAVMIGVLMTRAALMISLIRGTPRVICIPFCQGIQPQSWDASSTMGCR